MNADFRREAMKKLPAKVLAKIALQDIDREYTLDEVAIIMSAGPARALGLSQKGHLGVGADADVVIYNENKDVAHMFAYPRYVLKGARSSLRKAKSATSATAAPSAVRPPTTRRSRSIFVPSSSSNTRCRSTITPSARTASTGCTSSIPGRRHDDLPAERAAHRPAGDGGPVPRPHRRARARCRPGPARLPGANGSIASMTFFEIDGPPGDELELHGDLSRVKWIGRGMTRGRDPRHRQRRDAPRGVHDRRRRST